MPDLNEILAAAAKRHGFVTLPEVAVIAEADRLRLLLIRCGGCRFLCSAQYVTHLIACIEAGGDYVRDISLPTTDPIWPKTPDPVNLALRALLNCPPIVTSEHHPLVIAARKALGMAPPIPPAYIPPPVISGDVSPLLHFREEDCGGVFDGNTVTSDADPGL
jgi:hypothetical protein